MATVAGSTPRESATSRDAALAKLVEDYLARLQAGETIDPNDFVAEHPEHAERLARLLPALELMDDLRRSSIHPGSGLSLTPVPMETPGVEPGLLGDFQIVREVGRGGMGVVYEARQISLNRRVALKVLPLAAAMDPRQLQRFQLEAKAAACLHHTNIVPVHAVGCERGVHYYAMQFIEGQTLAAIIGELRAFEGLDEAQRTGPREGPPSLASRLASGELAPAEPSPSPLGGEGGPKGRMRGGTEDAGAVPNPRDPATPPATGKSPSGTLSSTPTRSRAFFRTVADLGIQAAEAIEHAHGLGVVHRDIKPANILIDHRGTLWITDFGLARLRNDTGLTMTGDLMGTLRYMSPEQAMGRGVDIDHRTDIYSLAVTLYELMTRKPAITGQDRQEVLRQIAHEEPIPPRRLVPAIPRELETIVLKAMDKEAAGRYQTAQELADDLKRFLEHRPIRARRPTWPERAIKWARRHMTLVVSAAMLLGLAVIGLSIGLLLISRERARAEDRYRIARRAVDQMYTRVAEQWLSQQPRLEPLQLEFLGEARQFYEDFAREAGTDPEIRYEAARASDRLARIEERLDHPREAEASFRQSIAGLERLAVEASRRKEPRSELANVYSHFGLLLEHTGRHDEAESAFRSSVEMHEALAKEFPDDPGILAGLVANLVNYSKRQNLSGRVREAEDSLRKAADIQRRQAALRPNEPYAQSALGATLNNLAQTVLNRGDPDAALALVVEAQRHQQHALQLKPGDPRARTYLRTHSLVEANIWKLKGDLSRAVDAFRRAIAQDEGLANDFPKVPRHQNDLANDHDELASVLKAAGRKPEAERALLRSLEVSDRLVADHPDQPQFLEDSAIILDNLGSFLAEEGRTDEAEEFRRRVVARMEGLVDRFPKRTDLRSRLGAALMNLSESRRARGATGEARQLLERAVSQVESALKDNPHDPDGRRIIGPVREALAAMPPTSAGRSVESKRAPEEAATPKPR